MKKTVAVIGFGRFGQLLTTLLLEQTDESLLIISSKKPPFTHPRIRWGTMADISLADIVFPCVPIREFEPIMHTISQHCATNAVIIDVCSVKVFAVNTMVRILPPTTQIIGTHPMFGPDSWAHNGGGRGLKMCICPVRVSPAELNWLRNLCRILELEVLEMSPEEHDRHAAFSLAYFSLVGRIGHEMGISRTPIDTPWFEKLLELQTVVERDSEQLFLDMQRFNPFTTPMRQEFLQALTRLNKKIELQ